MIMTESSRTIDAPPEAVFATVSDGERYGRAIPDIVRIEYVTTERTGVGARFRETRYLPSRFQRVLARLLAVETTESEILEFVENERVRLVTNDIGAWWHTVFTVTPLDDGRRTRLDVMVEVRPHSLLGRLLPPFIRGPVRAGLAGDLDAVKAHHEQQGGRGA